MYAFAMEKMRVVKIRVTGPFREKYWVRSAVRHVTPDEGEPYLVASANIFDQPPAMGVAPRIQVGSHIRTDDLLDMLQNAERVARDKIHQALA
ncbi:hypothetical protein [Noviherbaspirillum humi]|nr:hypothetical protein [Noviherbaspirillum humi]